MRVVFITPMDPFNVGGGAISAYRFIEPLKSLYRKGKIDDYRIIYLKKSDTVPVEDTDKFLYFPKRRLDRVRTAFRLNASPLELHSEEILSVLTEFNPNVIIMHFSTLGNLSKQIRKSLKNVKIIQNFDNFELGNTQHLGRGFLGKLSSIPMTYLIRKSEREALKSSNTVIFLRVDEANEIMKYYGIEKPYLIMPFTLGYSDPERYSASRKVRESFHGELRLLFTGSLDAWFNVEAVEFTAKNIDEIAKTLADKGIENFKVIIAGKDPGGLANLNKTCSNITVIPNPSQSQIEELFLSSHIFISPVFSGAGMKTKIVEALYHGIPIVASDTSLRGYRADVGDAIGKYIFPFKDMEITSFLSGLSSAAKVVLRQDTDKLCREIIDLYNDIYGIERFEQLLLRAIDMCFRSH